MLVVKHALTDLHTDFMPTFVVFIKLYNFFFFKNEVFTLFIISLESKCNLLQFGI